MFKSDQIYHLYEVKTPKISLKGLEMYITVMHSHPTMQQHNRSYYFYLTAT